MKSLWLLGEHTVKRAECVESVAKHHWLCDCGVPQVEQWNRLNRARLLGIT